MNEAKSSKQHNQQKVDRLIQIDYVMNNINNRFKDRIMDKFSDHYVQKNFGRDKFNNTEAGWIARDLQMKTGNKLANMLKKVNYKKRIESAERTRYTGNEKQVPHRTQEQAK